MLKINLILLLLLILDFHEKKENDDYEPTLAVTGSIKDAERVAELIKKYSTSIDEIFITLDTHHVSRR